MSSTVIEADGRSSPPPVSDQATIVGLESQILNSQEVIIRLNRELDSALLRISTLENLCAEHQSDLYEKRLRIKELNDEINEYEEKNEDFHQEILDRDERLKSLNQLILQLKQHIKQNEEQQQHSNRNDPYKCLIDELIETKFDLTIPEDFQIVRSQFLFDQQLRQYLFHQLDGNNSQTSPQAILEQIHSNQRLKFLDLLQKILTIDDISSLIDSNDILFESLTHFHRLKTTLRNARIHIHSNEQFDDFDFVKYILQKYDHYQQQQRELKEFLHVNEPNEQWDYARAAIERCIEATHVGMELHERVKKHEQTIDELHCQLEKSIQDAIQQRIEIDELVAKFGNDQDSMEETSGLARIRSILQSHTDFRHALAKEDIQKDDRSMIDELTKQIVDLNEQADKRHAELKAIAGSLGADNDDEESQFDRIRSALQSLADLRGLVLSEQTSNDDDNEAMIHRIRDYKMIIDALHPNEDPWTNETAVELVAKVRQMKNAIEPAEIEELADRFAPKDDNAVEESPLTRIGRVLQSSVDFRLALTRETQATSTEAILQSIRDAKIQFEQSSNQMIEQQQQQGENFRRRIQELIGVESNDPDEILHRIHQVYDQQNETIEQFRDLFGRTNPAVVKQEIEWARTFKEQLLARLSIADEKQIFHRLTEIEQTNEEEKKLNMTLTEQRAKLIEQEEIVEKLRAQRERMLNKMKEMKANNETLTSQLQIANQSLDDCHRNAVDQRIEFEEIQQQLRSANVRIEISAEECRAQQDLQETMKLENESLMTEMDMQRKLYETRCRTIVHEKNQLDKQRNELFEQKQILEDENKRLQTILNAIKDALENNNPDDLIEAVVALRRTHSLLIVELDRLRSENEKLMLTIRQNQLTLHEHIQTKIELERRLFDSEQHLIGIRQEMQEKIDELTQDLERIQNEYQQYRVEQQQHAKKTRMDTQAAMINIEQVPLPPQPHLLAVQQAAESNTWLAIDMEDQPIPLKNPHPIVDTLTALMNLFGEVKSKLGCTLTHRPRSSSVFFIYLCGVHMLTIYLLFFRHC